MNRELSIITEDGEVYKYTLNKYGYEELTTKEYLTFELANYDFIEISLTSKRIIISNSHYNTFLDKQIKRIEIKIDF